jgi:dephospho-CoA kinase
MSATPLMYPSGTLRKTPTSLRPVRRILVTGMSGTGKSSALAELSRRGFDVVDTDEPGWSEWSAAEDGYVWREDRIAELLDREGSAALYVSGTVSNQGRFYPRFDAVVLLSAPPDVLFDRIERRTTNHYGKSSEQRELIRSHIAEVEPLLRATCTHEIDASQPLEDVVAELAALGAGTTRLR